MRRSSIKYGMGTVQPPQSATLVRDRAKEAAMTTTGDGNSAASGASSDGCLDARVKAPNRYGEHITAAQTGTELSW
jgi:hypothetical protein